MSSKERGSDSEQEMADLEYQLFLASTVYKACEEAQGDISDGLIFDDDYDRQWSDSDYDEDDDFDYKYEYDSRDEDYDRLWDFDSDIESIDEDANDSVSGVVAPLMAAAATPGARGAGARGALLLAPSEGFKKKYLALLLSLFSGVVLGVVATLFGLASLSAFLDEE